VKDCYNIVSPSYRPRCPRCRRMRPCWMPRPLLGLAVGDAKASSSPAAGQCDRCLLAPCVSRGQALTQLPLPPQGRGYNFKAEPKRSDSGAFMQLLWRASTKIGCALKKCDDGWHWLLCYFNPPGNQPGKYVANVLAPGKFSPPPPRRPPPPPVSLQGDMKTVFDEMNSYRAVHTAGALVWVAALASAVVGWLSKCRPDSDPASSYGETVTTAKYWDPLDYVDGWYDEVRRLPLACWARTAFACRPAGRPAGRPQQPPGRALPCPPALARWPAATAGCLVPLGPAATHAPDFLLCCHRRARATITRPSRRRATRSPSWSGARPSASAAPTRSAAPAPAPPTRSCATLTRATGRGSTCQRASAGPAPAAARAHAGAGHAAGPGRDQQVLRSSR
jgi:hypothetical protein